MAESSNTKMIGEIAVSVARIEERMIRFDQTTAELVKIIKGNGQPGLAKRVQDIENRHCNEDDDKKDAKENKKKWGDRTWAFIMLFVAQLVIWLFLFLRTLPA